MLGQSKDFFLQDCCSKSVALKGRRKKRKRKILETSLFRLYVQCKLIYVSVFSPYLMYFS